MSSNKNNIRERVIHILCERINKEPDDIKDEDRLDSLGIDSLDQVEIVMEIEKEFNTTISDEQASSMETVADIYNLLQKITNEDSES